MCTKLKASFVADTQAVLLHPERLGGMAMACESSGLGFDLSYFTCCTAYFLAEFIELRVSKTV
jgi:hypothetical protein